MAEHQLYLTYGPHPRKPGVMIAICTRGQPQFGDKNIDVLTMELVKTPDEARAWFDRVKNERPWESRN